MIILNPIDGAPISNVQLRGLTYFKEKPFEIDSMVKIDNDEAANDLINLYEFLVTLTPEDAKSYKEEQEKRKFACERCGEKFTVEKSLEAHVNRHIEAEKLDKELGLEVISGEEKTVVDEDTSAQDKVDAQARSEGLDYGEGLRKE